MGKCQGVEYFWRQLYVITQGEYLTGQTSVVDDCVIVYWSTQPSSIDTTRVSYLQGHTWLTTTYQL